MEFWISVLEILDTQMKTPTLYGPYHLFWLLVVVFSAVLLCGAARKHSPRQVCNVVLGIAIAVTVLEIYKQINYTFSYDNGVITASYQWYAFPWQFCSTPMYIGLLAGIFRKGKFHDCLCAYLATYAIFAGLCVMVYPGDVFCTTVGINLQTMVWHGSMIVVGLYLLASGHVKLEHRTILKAIPVFVAVVLVAMVMNEIAYQTGLLEEHTFNMFYISPHCDPHLPVYSAVQAILPFPLELTVYVMAFSAAAYVILLAAMAVQRQTSRRTAHAPRTKTTLRYY